MSTKFEYNKEAALLHGYYLSAQKNGDQLVSNLLELQKLYPEKQDFFHKITLYLILKSNGLLSKEEEEYFESLEIPELELSVATYLELVFQMKWERLAVYAFVRMSSDCFTRWFYSVLKLGSDVPIEAKLLLLEICMMKINQLDSQDAATPCYLKYAHNLLQCSSASVHLEAIFKVISTVSHVLMSVPQNVDPDPLKFWSSVSHPEYKLGVEANRGQLNENIGLRLQVYCDLLDQVHHLLQQPTDPSLSSKIADAQNSETFNQNFVPAFQEVSALMNRCNNFKFNVHPAFGTFKSCFRSFNIGLFETDVMAIAEGKEVDAANVLDLVLIILEDNSLLSNTTFTNWIQTNLTRLSWRHLHFMLAVPKSSMPHLTKIFVQLYSNQTVNQKIEVYNLWLDQHGTSERLLQKNGIQQINEAFNKQPDKGTILNYLIQSPKRVLSKLLSQVVDNSSKITSVEKMLSLLSNLCLYKAQPGAGPFLLERCKELANQPKFSEQQVQNLNKFIVKIAKDKSEKILKKIDLIQHFILPQLVPQGNLFDLSVQMLQFLIIDKDVPWLIEQLDSVALLLACVMFATSNKESYNSQRADKLLSVVKNLSPFVKTALDEKDIQVIRRVALDLPPSTYLYLSPLLGDHKIEEKEASLEFALFGYEPALLVPFFQDSNSSHNHLVLVSALVQVFPSSTHSEMQQFLTNYKYLVKVDLLVLPEGCENVFEGFLQLLVDVLIIATEAGLFIPWSYVVGFLMIMLKKWNNTRPESFFLEIVRLSNVVPASKSSSLSLLLSDILQTSSLSFQTTTTLSAYIKAVPFPNIRRQLIKCLNNVNQPN